uniref:Slc38a-6 n=1 Tax=Schmidtea mediterranea TaxID=79327 RepID=A0A0H3YFB3_SCHMD|nr:slc38a-6 [Schmidtea mediterranea]
MLNKVNENTSLINPILIKYESDSDSDRSRNSSEINYPEKRGSLVTIFSIYNTMMGATIISMPWAIQQAGLGLGILLLLFIGALTLYTAILVLKSTNYIIRTRHCILEFSDACGFYLGRIGEISAIISSIFVLMSSLIVYYVLLCNFLFLTVLYVFNYIIDSPNYAFPENDFPTNTTNPQCFNWLNNSLTSYYVVSKDPLSHLNNVERYQISGNSSVVLLKALWSENLTVPFWVLIIIFPLISIKSATFVSRFNAFGTISVIYLIILIMFKFIKWGVHLDFANPRNHVTNFGNHFTALTGICSLAFFIHNAIHYIMSNQDKPENNVRDVSIAYSLVALTYLVIGVLFYIIFPFDKECIQDNLLNNLSVNDSLAVIGRLMLLFQIITVFPLLVNILRTQFMYHLFKTSYPR